MSSQQKGRPLAIAVERARLYFPDDALARERFVGLFQVARIKAFRGDDNWPEMRAALAADDSLAVAAFVEGAASIRERV